MKKSMLTLTIFALFICFNALAQKVKNKGLNGMCYLQPPLISVLQQFSTYQVVINQKLPPATKDWIKLRIKLQGFEKVEENPDFIVEFYKKPFVFGRTVKHSNQRTVEKEGTKTKIISYYYTVDAHYDFKISIPDVQQKGGDCYKKHFKGTKTIKTNESTDANIALSEIKRKKENFIHDFAKNYTTEICKVLNNELCYTKKYIRLRTGIIKPKKHEYSDYEKSYALFLKGVDIIKNDVHATKQAEDFFNQAKQGFLRMLEESDPENRRARINNDVTALLLCNIGNCCFLMRDYQNALKYFTKAEKLDKMIGYSSAMITYTQQILDRYNLAKS